MRRVAKSILHQVEGQAPRKLGEDLAIDGVCDVWTRMRPDMTNAFECFGVNGKI